MISNMIEQNLQNQSQIELMIKGIIDFDNAPILLKKISEFIEQQTETKEIILNFSGLQQSNSAGLALFTALLRQAKQYEKNLQFMHLPANLWAAAQISDLDKVLPCT